MFKFTIQILVIGFLYRDTVCFINTYCFPHIDADYFQPLLIERCGVFRRSASYHSVSYLPLFSELFSVPFLSFPVGELYPVLLAAFSPVSRVRDFNGKSLGLHSTIVVISSTYNCPKLKKK